MCLFVSRLGKNRFFYGSTGAYFRSNGKTHEWSRYISVDRSARGGHRMRLRDCKSNRRESKSSKILPGLRRCQLVCHTVEHPRFEMSAVIDFFALALTKECNSNHQKKQEIKFAKTNHGDIRKYDNHVFPKPTPSKKYSRKL